MIFLQTRVVETMMWCHEMPMSTCVNLCVIRGNHSRVECPGKTRKWSTWSACEPTRTGRESINPPSQRWHNNYAWLSRTDAESATNLNLKGKMTKLGKKWLRILACLKTHLYLCITSTHPLATVKSNASMQELSRRIQCYNTQRSQATPEDMSKFYETRSGGERTSKINCCKECK
jgi:hypothetical protein